MSMEYKTKVVESGVRLSLEIYIDKDLETDEYTELLSLSRRLRNLVSKKRLEQGEK